jgi:hypothetical protein
MNPYLEKILQRHKLYVGGKSVVLEEVPELSPTTKTLYEGGAGSEQDLATKILKSLKTALSNVVERRKKVNEALKKIQPLPLENGGGLILFNSKQECTSFIYFIKENNDIGVFKIPKANMSSPEPTDAAILTKPFRRYLSDIHQIWDN